MIEYTAIRRFPAPQPLDQPEQSLYSPTNCPIKTFQKQHLLTTPRGITITATALFLRPSEPPPNNRTCLLRPRFCAGSLNVAFLEMHEVKNINKEIDLRTERRGIPRMQKRKNEISLYAISPQNRRGEWITNNKCCVATKSSYERRIHNERFE
jgi:hypothetical protein